MPFRPILLVKAGSLEEAKTLAVKFCENECRGDSVFDYWDIVGDADTVWNRPLNEVKDKLPEDDHLEKAEKLFYLAHDELRYKKNYDMAGYYCRKAGELFSQRLSTEYPLFNIQFYDYSRDYGDGWYAIEADLHF